MAGKIIAVDFDDTLAATGADANNVRASILDAEPIENVVRYTNAQFNDGNFIIIYTARPWADREQIEAWLILHGVMFDVIKCGKLRCTVLVDDRTKRPEEV